ncbi:hypothetical protein KLVA111870_08800 [Klebsiella variicola]|nr:hypothetical protein SB5387_03558 [Klebsiella variicola]
MFDNDPHSHQCYDALLDVVGVILAQIQCSAICSSV